jgi:ubiquinone/menaquinone biosynthesis C-methylase UbiE
MTDLDPLIHAFYRDRYVEDDRLSRTAHGQLEFLRTQELLRRHLPLPPATILDVGGATGVHARWLAADGYEVHLIDPVPEHVEQAAAAGTFTASVGDARDLEQADASVDVTMLLGPLYHLVEAADRAQALAEAARVTKPGGLVVAAGISRYAALLEVGANGRLTADMQALVVDALATGRHHDDPNGFTSAYFHHADELATELRTAGLSQVTVFGVEGPSAPALDNVPLDQVPAFLDAAIRCARVLETDPALISASPHFLGVAGREPARYSARRVLGRGQSAADPVSR